MNDKIIEIQSINYENFHEIKYPLRLKHGTLIFAIHSIGKVASKSIYTALKNCIDTPIYHLHYLNEDTLNQMYTWFVTNTSYKSDHAEIIDGKSFANIFHNNKDDFNWKIITLIREPISWQISMLFELTLIAFPQIIKNNIFDYEAFKELATKSFRKTIDSPILNNSFYLKWWDLEFTPIFGLDLIKQPFNQNKGWEIYKEGKTEILVIQYEQLNNVFEEAALEFGLPNEIILPEINKTSDKQLGECNPLKVVSEFKLLGSLVNDLYNNRIVKHFYNQEQIDNFTLKWVI